MPAPPGNKNQGLEATLALLRAGEPGAALLAQMLSRELQEALRGTPPSPDTLLVMAVLKDLLGKQQPEAAGPLAAVREAWEQHAQGSRDEAEEEGLGVDLSTLTTDPDVKVEAQALGKLLRTAAAAQRLDHELSERLAQWLAPALPTSSDTPARRRRSGIEPWPALLKFPADRIHKGAVEAFSAADQWRQGAGFYRAYEVSGGQKDFAMLCGFPADPGEEIWKLLLSRGEGCIKAHYALWARLYEQTGGRPGEYAVININQFCSDLGYKPHHKGGFKRERKQEAMRLLEALTTVEIAVRFRVAGKSGRVREISGRLWERGFTARERDQYGDLFGQAREGEPGLWDPAGFTYGPGPWFADAAWRRQNQYLGLIGAGLMKLQADTDQTAIRIGGYLGTLARLDQYRTRRIRITTLLHRIGMAASYPRHPQRLQDLIEKALAKLIEVKILARWDYTDADPSEPDMDDPEDLAALADTPLTPWRRKTIEIEWPELLVAETKRLENAERHALSAASKLSRLDSSKKPE